MKKKSQGYAVIEFNHGGIPDNELQPEEFNQLQVSVLNALPADRKQPILRGYPAAVVNLATGELRNIRKRHSGEHYMRQHSVSCRIRRMQKSSQSGKSSMKRTAPDRIHESTNHKKCRQV